MNIEVFVNKLTEASIILNNDLGKMSVLNNLKSLLLNTTFNQINTLDLNSYILSDCIQSKLNKVDAEVLVNLSVDWIYNSFMILNWMLTDSQYKIKSLKVF